MSGTAPNDRELYNLFGLIDSLSVDSALAGEQLERT